jgi:hypothetical protein
MCVEERAKPSLAVLASMEMFSPTLPAVFYRRASSLIANSTHDILCSVSQIANVYGRLIEDRHFNARTRYIGRVVSWKDAATAFNVRGEAGGAAWFIGVPGDENQEWSVSGVEICPGQWHEVRNHMITHGFGMTFDDGISVNGGDWSGVAEWMFLEYHDIWMRGLSQCLRIDS